MSSVVEPMSDKELQQIDDEMRVCHPDWPADNWWSRLKARLDALQAVVDKLEWTGTRIDGTGCRMGYADRDGIRRAACPMCHGYKPHHEPGCAIAEAAMRQQSKEPTDADV